MRAGNRKAKTMRVGLAATFALALLIETGLPAVAGGGFEVVIPGRPGVPIVINGIDASYAVVEGDWGLSKGGHVQPKVYGGRPIDPVPRVGHYYPSSGRLPGYGRLEIEPPASRVLPQPAESFHQSWSAQSTPQPVQPEVPFYPPPVILAPQVGEPGTAQEPENRPNEDEPRKLRKLPH
jgi:hypothetical protein